MIGSEPANERLVTRHRFVRPNGSSLFDLLGLSFLISSAYFLPVLTPAGAYLLPSHDLFSLVVLPTIVGLLAGMLAILAIFEAARRWLSPQLWTAPAVIAVSMLVLIGAKGVLYAAGLDWRNVFPHGSDLLASARNVKYVALVAAFVIVWITKGAIRRWCRVLASLGFAFGVLAVSRVFVIWLGIHVISSGSATAAADALRSLQLNSITMGPGGHRQGFGSRRAVWVIFDEADFQRIFAAGSSLKLENFDRLSKVSVFATNANSPASATLYSIPALLTGVPITGDGIHISSSASLSLEHEKGSLVPFGQATSIFGALDGDGQRASVLGFYHPYCNLFRLRSCASFGFPEVGGVDGVLWANVPDAVASRIRRFDYWESMTRKQLELLPEYLAREDVLTFIHLDIPHPPSTYADHLLHFEASGDPVEEYSHNLLLADRVLGEIVKLVQDRSSRDQVLLVISADHWYRNRWYQAAKAESSRPVPLLIWLVGNTDGVVMNEPVSTVHTAAMILDYLNGYLEAQSDIARWWSRQPVFPTFIAPSQ